MNGKDIERLLAPMIARPPADLDIRMRKLRESGLLPSGGRGLNAPELEPQHAAIVLVAIGAAERSTEAARGAIDFAALVEPGAYGGTFLEVLTAIVADARHAADVDDVTIDRSSRTARIRYLDGRVRVFLEPAAAASLDLAAAAGFGLSRVRDLVAISGAVIAQLAVEFDDAPAGYAASRA